MICSDPIANRHFASIRFPWHGIHFVSNTHSKPSSLLSYLVNVNIHNVGERNGRVQPAIACNGTFPYTENVTIANSTKAISASFMAFNGNKNRMGGINIANCFYGIELKFDRHESPPMNTTIGFAYEMTRITINGCYEGITIYNSSSKDINLRNIKINNCIHGISVTISMFNRFTISATHMETKRFGVSFNSLPPSQLLSTASIDLCNSGAYFVTSPISVRDSRNGVLLCAMVSMFINMTNCSRLWLRQTAYNSIAFSQNFTVNFKELFWTYCNLGIFNRKGIINMLQIALELIF